MRRTLYVNVDAEYDMDFDELLELIQDCSKNEKNQIRELIKTDTVEKLDTYCNGSIYDEMKMRVLNVAMKKYNLKELQEKLDIKNNEY